jgi:hypothetical protein
MQNFPTIASDFLKNEIKKGNFFNEKGEFDFSKVKAYVLSDQRRVCKY